MEFARSRKHQRRAGRRWTAALLLSTLVAGGIAGSANGVAAAPVGTSVEPPVGVAGHAYVPGIVVVGYEAGIANAERADVRATVDSNPATGVQRVAPDTERVKLDDGESVTEAIAKLRSQPGVRYAEPDYLLHKEQQSDDPAFTDGRLWGMYGDTTTPGNQFGSQAAEAWAQGQVGSRNVYVGVIDEGVQITHPDLAANTWTNPFDPPDGIDNDGNGYVDDTHGWDFINNDASVFDGDPVLGFDDHGTHVSGTIAGVGGNGTGVAGVNWQATIIPAKFLGPYGGTTSDAVRAVDYLTDLKVRHGLNIVATSNSWGGGGYSQALLDAINRAADAGILFVAAAQNNALDNDTAPAYPANYECTNGGTRGWDCVISVAALGSAGGLASFSDYGARTVDLGAPGVDVWSTVPDGSYASYSGTSMATPHVSGAVALCAAANPGATAQQLREAVLESVAPTPSLAGRTVTGGRLDIGAMIGRCQPQHDPVVGKPRNLRSQANIDSVHLTWTDGAQHEERFRVQQADAVLGALCGRFRNVGFASANAASFDVTGLTPSTRYCFRVRAENSFGGGTTSSWSNVVTSRTTHDYVCRAAPYAWTDPTNGGTNLGLADDGFATVPLPFPVEFYGRTTSTVNVSANGFVRFDSGPAMHFENQSIPSPSDPNNFAAPYWDDLNPGAGGGVWIRTAGTAPHRRLVIGWVDVPHYPTQGNTSFELVLAEDDGGITFRYRDVDFGDPTVDRGASATAGIENATGTRGRQLGFNAAGLSNQTAYRCSTDPTARLSINTTRLRDATEQTSYRGAVTAAGGRLPLVWSVTRGSLPTGLTLDGRTGVISGTPRRPGSAEFTVQVLDTRSPQQVASRAMQLIVRPQD